MQGAVCLQACGNLSQNFHFALRSNYIAKN
jgi:hypothetical protein